MALKKLMSTMKQDEFRLIPIKGGKFAKVDLDDFERLNSYKWQLSSKGYAKRGEYDPIRKKNTTVFMHNDILPHDLELICDHRDRDRLNNTKENLRLVSKAENARNRSRSTLSKTSKYKGVSYYKSRDKWLARIGYDGNIICLGYFKTEEEAGLAYNRKALELFGEFAVLNNIERGEV